MQLVLQPLTVQGRKSRKWLKGIGALPAWREVA